MTTTPTTLLPLNARITPEQTTRLLAIRANLLPDEVTGRRTVRRMKLTVIAVVGSVAVALCGWYFDAYQDMRQANSELAAVNTQVDAARAATHRKDLTEVTRVAQQNKLMAERLKTLMAGDLPWSTLLDKLRATGANAGITITTVNVTAAAAQVPGSTTPNPISKGVIATLTLGGSGKDKKAVAGFIDALSHVPGLANPYLTTAAENHSKVTFNASVDVTSAAVCGPYTTACTTGGK